MAGIQRIRLNNLNSNISNALIVGIIVAKSSLRITKQKNNKKNENRGVMTITIRDSDVDVINCDIWGSDYFVTTYYENFQIGDIVEIVSPKIIVKDGNRSEMYRPMVSSPFFLTVNEGQSEVVIHSCEAGTFAAFQNLLHVPTKPASGYYGLGDVLKISDIGPNTFVDVLVVVKSIGTPKTIKTKAGVDMTICTVEVIDNTTPASVPLCIYDLEMIKRALGWRPLESVLFIADARVSNRGGSLQLVSRSVVTHQPHTPDAETLRLFTRSRSSAPRPVITPCSGAEAASVRQVKDRSKTPTQFTITIVAYVTHLDLDKITPSYAGGMDLPVELRIRFADHTGELTAVMDSHILESGLENNTGDLMKMSADDKNAVRWKFLLERCCAQLSVYGSRIAVLGMRRAGENDSVPLY